MSAIILNFPRHHEIKKLIAKNNLLLVGFTKEELDKIEETIVCIRETHGRFNYEHFPIVLRYLDHEWQPQDIPVLLPRTHSLEALN